MAGNFLNTTNNRVKSLNSKLISVIHLYSVLEEFLERLFIFMSSIRIEREHQAAMLFQRKQVSNYIIDSPKDLYQKHLTSYAAGFVLHNLRTAVNVELKTINGQYIVSKGSHFVIVETERCFCSIF